MALEESSDVESIASDSERFGPGSQLASHHVIRLAVRLLQSQAAVGGEQAAFPPSEVSLPASSDVARLRRELAVNCGLFAREQLQQQQLEELRLPRLVWRGRVLRDGHSLEAAGLYDGECIYVVPAAVTPTVKPTAPARLPSMSEEVLPQILAMYGLTTGSGGDIVDQLMSAVGSNSRLRTAFESNPILGQLLDRPQDLRAVMGSMQSSRVRQEMMRNMDLEMRRIESIPRGAEVLRNHWEEQNRLLEELSEAMESESAMQADRRADVATPSRSSSRWPGGQPTSGQQPAAADESFEIGGPTAEALPNVWSLASDSSATRSAREAAREAEISEEDARLLERKVLPWEGVLSPPALAELRQDEATQLLLEAMAGSAGINLQDEEALTWPQLDLTVLPAPSAGDEDNPCENVPAASGGGSEDVQAAAAGKDAAAASGGHAPGQQSATMSWKMMEDDAESMLRTDVLPGQTEESGILAAERATIKEAETRWHHELKAMERAGLSDHAANAHALRVCDGSLDRAINHLLR